MNFLLAVDAVKQLAGEQLVETFSGPDTAMLLLTVFVLAVFIGVEVITKIPPTLHTPLMSGSNAISGIALVGAVLAAGTGDGILPKMLGCIAVTLATINVVGGFMVTHRMLGMFRRKD
jgi:NAD(P) transhydrogenase subunit alpha